MAIHYADIFVAELKKLLREMQKEAAEHLCSACDLSDDEREFIQGRRDASKRYADRLEALLKVHSL